ACVALAAARLAKDDPDATCLVLPADHVIGELDRYRAAMNAGLDHVTEHGGLLTFGIRPERPETGYGYLELGPDQGTTSGWAVHRLKRFIEKPDSEAATHLVTDGKHLWNSGMFAWRATDLLKEVRRQLPVLAEGIDRLIPSLGTPAEDEALTRIYPKLPRTSVDYGVMEGALSTWTIPVDFPWSDVGSWPALRDVLPSDPSGNFTNGPCVTVDADDNVVVSEGPTVAIVGASNLIVVATQDAVLVVPIEQAQRVKDVVAELRKQGRTDLL
ncbi:MAG: mannose-1-phosphate guanylyltransferase, partial [bacterium]|nr:mannose-1-phosphate guanylyltransferase [bacterium]